MNRATVSFILSCMLGIFVIGKAACAQGFVHPPQSMTEADFPQPPDAIQSRVTGPTISSINAQCWHVEPSDPEKFVGGTMDTQNITGFIPMAFPDGSERDTTFQQNDFRNFAGGGSTAVLKQSDIPPGIFLSFRAHPIYRITKLEFPVRQSVPIFPNFGRVGVRIFAEFKHLPRMGECYFYAAAWLVAK